MALPDGIDDLQTTLQTICTGRTKDCSVLQNLATSSRSDQSIRLTLAQPAILRILTLTVTHTLRDSTVTASLALRCIGNACIDNNDARSAVSAVGFGWASPCVASQDQELSWLTVKVLYNICSDHDGAQQQCFEDQIHCDLIQLCIARKDVNVPQERSLLVDLLFWITGQRDKILAAGGDVALPGDLLRCLLILPNEYSPSSDLEDLATLLEICLSFIRDPNVQSQIVHLRFVQDVWQLFNLCEFTISLNADAGEIMLPLSTSLMWCLSDIAADDRFSQLYSLDDPWVQVLCNEIRGGGSGDRHIAAACQVVGNLIRTLSEEQVADLVVMGRLHEHLWVRLTRSAELCDPDVQHSIAGFLVQLSRPSAAVRDIIGQSEHAGTALSTLCASKVEPIRQDGMRLLRALGKDCAVNQERFGALAASLREKDRTSGTTSDALMLDSAAAV
ncbi:hypothetical protein LTR62_004046 [Meristemomyces frigidus]|uniref:Uncharacterized protein n=1 Tax=Meristemomyces frigidus TaxID=1508187 RepID=A0AAN7TPK2_9PEZI|nr:hypothetical protein LTR62_004046 [Meristemomyces frigidus]